LPRLPPSRLAFQSTPRFVGEGNNCPRPIGADRVVSIHPPLCRRGEHLRRADRRNAGRFQSTPRFVGEGNVVNSCEARVTSGFQSTPRFVGEGNPSGFPKRRCRRCFNPPPALSARGTREDGGSAEVVHVSIHPPLCRRGEPAEALRAKGVSLFQSTPRFVGEGNARASGRRGVHRGFNPPPALSARGTLDPPDVVADVGVSIHPPLCRRGEHSEGAASVYPGQFQSTPRFVGEGNSPSAE